MVLVAPGPLGAPCRYGMLMIDSTIIRACQHAACAKGQQTQALGRCRVGFTTKLHAVCECVVQFAPVHHDGRRTASFYTQTQALLGGGSTLTPCLPTRVMRRMRWSHGFSGDTPEFGIGRSSATITTGCTRSAIWWNGCSGYFTHFRQVTIRYDKTRSSSCRTSTSPPVTYGSIKCRQNLVSYSECQPWHYLCVVPAARV